MRTPIKFFVLLLPLALGLQGCTVTGSGTVTVSCGGGKPCSYGGTAGVSVSSKFIGQNATSSNVSTMSDGSWTISASVPNVFSSDPNGTPAATLIATTDTGYSSSITVGLTPVAAAISPINSGDIVYSYNLANSPDLTNWIQSIQANTISTLSFEADQGIPLTANPSSPATYQISTVITSNSIGSVSGGNAKVPFKTPAGPPCIPGQYCTQ